MLFRSPTPTYEVTLSANEEGGTILTAGAKDLKMVPYGTDLFIVDNPKEGYEPVSYTHLDVYKRQA